MMSASTVDYQHPVIRPITRADVRTIVQMVKTAARIHTRFLPAQLSARLLRLPGCLVEDGVGLRGFMVIEPQHPGTAVIVAAGIRDTWGIHPYLNLILPEIERIAHQLNLGVLAYVGHEEWLVEGLLEYGFEIREWIILFERFGTVSPVVTGPQPALIRMAHRTDLAAILALDSLAFDHLWRKSASHFNEALANVASFRLAEMAGELVGYAWCELYGRRGHLTRLAVHPDHQGLGIGGQLLHQAIIDVLAAGADLITLNTQETNYRSRALYERFGFVYTNQRKPVLWKKL